MFTLPVKTENGIRQVFLFFNETSKTANKVKYV